MSHVTPAGLGSQVSGLRAHPHLANGGHVRGEADEPMRKPFAQVMLSFVLRPDGGFPCGGRRATPAFYVNSYLTPPFGTFTIKSPDFSSFSLSWIHIRFTLDSPLIHHGFTISRVIGESLVNPM